MRRVLWIILLLVVVTVGSRVYSVQKSQDCIDAYINRLNTLFGNDIKATLGKHNFDLSGGKAVIDIALKSNTLRYLFKQDRVLLDVNISYGPVLFTKKGIEFGCMRLSGSINLVNYLKADIKNRLSQRLKEPVNIRYTTTIGYKNSIKDRIKLSSISLEYPKEALKIDTKEIKITSEGLLNGIKNRVDITTDEVTAKSLVESKSLQIYQLKIKYKIDEYDKKSELLFGFYRVSANKVCLDIDLKKGLSICGRGYTNISIDREKDTKYATIKLDESIQILTPSLQKSLGGIESIDGSWKLEHIGISGLAGLIRVQQKQSQIEKELANSVKVGDERGMQRAILELQSIESDTLISIGKAIIPHKTHLVFKQNIKADRLSSIKFDAYYTGEPIRGDFMTILLRIATNPDKLISGKFDINLEADVIKALYPNALFVLESMANKGLAKFSEGLYHLKGQIEGGKVIINGTKYAPQELIMMILM